MYPRFAIGGTANKYILINAQRPTPNFQLRQADLKVGLYGYLRRGSANLRRIG
jgi:hypothetical protein